MLKLNLPDYRILQDSHFSPGGASGGTGKPGEADPLETHVYLQTTESDETAQEMLDISERIRRTHTVSQFQNPFEMYILSNMGR